MQQYFDAILENGIIAIVRGVSPQKIIPTVEALHAGGIKAAEITFNHKASGGIEETLESMQLLQAHFKGEILMGAGTVLTPNQVQAAAACGAKYMISPNVDLAVIAETKRLGCLSFPGALTPSEIVAAYAAGADAIKLFPSDTLGLDYIKALMGPLGHIPYFAVGGVSPENMAQFFDAGVKGVGVGGKLVNLKAIEAGEFSKITETAKRYTDCWKTFNNR